jgi:hypothetical protein
LAATLRWPDPIFLTVTRTQGLSVGHTDVSLWYVVQGDATAQLAPDPGEFYRVRWFGFDQLPLDRTDPHLVRFVVKLKEKLSCSKKYASP